MTDHRTAAAPLPRALRPRCVLTLVAGLALGLQCSGITAPFAHHLDCLAASPDVAPAAKYAYPASSQLEYEGTGQERGFLRYTGHGMLQWSHDTNHYDARLEISAWGIRVRTWTSTGALGLQGLQPARFGDTPRGKELVTRFEHDKNRITFSSGDGDLPLLSGAQDKLSALLQLSAVVGADPQRYSGGGNTISFQAADSHRAERWEFKVSPQETLQLPDGGLTAIKLTKEANPEVDQKIEVWLAAAAAYLPVRIRITESSGNFVDLMWQKTQKPD